MQLRRTPTMGAFAAALALAALAACNASTTEDPVPVVTGVRIDTLSLFGVDSCGLASTQIAKSGVTVANAPDDAGTVGGVLRHGTFDCFTDPAFVEPFATRRVYTLRVFGFSSSTYQQHAPAIETALAQRGEAAVEADAELVGLANVVATCTAFQYENVNSTAACTIDLDTRPHGDAGADAALADAGDDAASDAGPTDAGEDAALDAGSDAAANDAGDAGDGGS